MPDETPDLQWIDASCRGGSARDHAAGTPTVSQLLGEMDRLRLARALVTSASSDVVSHEVANQQLFDDLSGHERLLPVPEVVPEGGERFLDRPADAIADLVARGAVAGIAQGSRYPLTEWCAGEMLEAMQATRLPLMVRHDEVLPQYLPAVLRDFPQLPVLLQEVPRVGYNRMVYPLMRRFSQLHVVCDPPQFVFKGIDYLVDRLGADQLVWGTRFPQSEGGAAIAGITYARISDAAREAIAGDNIERLMEQVCRG